MVREEKETIVEMSTRPLPNMKTAPNLLDAAE
jgi:hypothetical protein